MNQTEAISDTVITRVQLARYMLDALGGKTSSLKLIKLIALADIYKFRLDGETITGDIYVALKNGPAPSATSNIIIFNGDYAESGDLAYAGEYIEKCNMDVSMKGGSVEYDHLSDFDKKCADYVVEKYGHLSAEELIEGNNGENVHAFEAWKKHNIHDYGAGQVQRIQMEDFFKNDGPVQVDSDSIKQAQKRYAYGDF